MGPDNHPARPPEDVASGPAREWLAREQRRASAWASPERRQPRRKASVPWFWVFAAVFIPLRLYVLPGLIGYWPSWIITALVIYQGSRLWEKWWQERKTARDGPA